MTDLQSGIGIFLGVLYGVGIAIAAGMTVYNSIHLDKMIEKVDKMQEELHKFIHGD